MGVTESFGGLVLSGGVGLLLSLIGVGYVQRYRRLRRTDPVDARDLGGQEGSVELAGTARPHETSIESPFTATESLLCEWKVRDYRRRRNRSGWRTIDSGHAFAPFVLDDGTGRVLIDPEGASRDVTDSDIVDVDPAASPPPEVGTFLDARDGIDREDERKRRYVESRLDPGDDVHVLGPIRESGHSVDLPGGVDAVVGVENPDERGITLGEDGLSTMIEKARADADRFVVTTAGERETERRTLKRGVVSLAVGALFLLVAVAFVAL